MEANIAHCKEMEDLLYELFGTLVKDIKLKFVEAMKLKDDIHKRIEGRPNEWMVFCLTEEHRFAQAFNALSYCEVFCLKMAEKYARQRDRLEDERDKEIKK